MRKHRDIKLLTTETRRNDLVSEPNYHTIFFSISNRNEKKKTNMNKSVDLGLSIMIKPVKQ